MKSKDLDPDPELDPDPDPDPGCQQITDPPDPDPQHWYFLNTGERGGQGIHGSEEEPASLGQASRDYKVSSKLMATFNPFPVFIFLDFYLI